MAYEVTSIVTGAANSYALVTLAILKDELGITDNASDAKLTRYLNSASAVIANHCHRVFPKETLADHFSRNRVDHPWRNRFERGDDAERVLQTARYPVVSIASISVEGTALTAGVDYSVDKDRGHIRRLDAATGMELVWDCFPVDVVYDAGFEAIPEDVQDAAVRIVRTRWYAKDRDPLARQESIPGVRDITWWVPAGSDAGNLPPDVVELLSPYVAPLRLG